MLMPHVFLQRIDATTKMMFINFGIQKFYLHNYLNSVKKYLNGRYDVELPFKENNLAIHNHFTSYKTRFCNTITRLKRELQKNMLL